MSLLVFANVVSTIPTGFNAVRLAKGSTWFAGIVVISLALLVAVVFVEQGQRRIPVQFAKRVVGRRQMGGQSTYIPLKVNQSGVIPIIFASSVLQFPIMIATVLPTTFRTWANNHLANPSDPVYIISYGLLIILFAYFYTRIAFDPVKQADVIRKQGGYIPGIRPGRPTEQHLTGILNRITLPGSLYLALVALIPSLFLSYANVKNFPFAGTSLLISTGVALETMKQVDSQLTMRNYEGFLK
jgi:preprotein translocase subunit SecY